MRLDEYSHTIGNDTRSRYRGARLIAIVALLSIVLTHCDQIKVTMDDPDVVAIETDPDGYAEPPPVRTFPSSPEKINDWVITMDHSRLRAHAWDIWESITTTTTSGLPVWETWYSGYELFNLDSEDGRPTHRDFESPTQFFHASVLTSIPDDPAERPVSFNRFSKSLAVYISQKGYNSKATLDSINTSFDQQRAAVVDRQIQASQGLTDPMSFALKPVFQFISGDSITAFPYWAGVSVASTTNLSNPEPHTWRQCVIIDPDGKLEPGSMYEASCNGEPAQQWPVVSLQSFYAIKITQAEADSFIQSSFGFSSGDDVGQDNLTDTNAVKTSVKAGNIALMTAMHVTGKEINKWTWQTFWWSPAPGNPVFGADRPGTIPAPWSSYNMRTAYYMVSPPNTKQGGEPLISFNPYLETNLSGKVPMENNPAQSIQWYGVFSNCMSCHRMAVYPKSDYVPDGFVDPADPLRFSKNTKTDFLWSIPTRAQ